MRSAVGDVVIAGDMLKRIFIDNYLALDFWIVTGDIQTVKFGKGKLR